MISKIYQNIVLINRGNYICAFSPLPVKTIFKCDFVVINIVHFIFISLCRNLIHPTSLHVTIITEKHGIFVWLFIEKYALQFYTSPKVYFVDTLLVKANS